MGRIEQPELRQLSEEWSDEIIRALDTLGRNMWPPFKRSRGLLAKPEMVTPYSVEGPAVLGEQVCWTVAHVIKPSAFDDRGRLTQGERAFWMVAVRPGDPPRMTIEGKSAISLGLDPSADWKAALAEAARIGPKVEPFFGNKGPLSHR